ncbi:MAG: beta-ketoacyl-ACP synthase II [Defluviitaleaceae bacterium]|nr:beta-ketoacyl-ACP synthase II [Defluviitaleaceae bacterium]
MTETRVVITGIGLITSLGSSIDEFWDNIKNGRHGFAPITRFDTERYKVKLAAEVKGFDAEKYIERKETKRLDLYSQYALAAAEEAMVDSGMDVEAIKGSIRAGVYFGSGIGGLVVMQEQISKLLEKGPERVNPLFIPMTIANMAAGHISLKYGLKGPSIPIVTACASSTNCLGEAFRAIKHGYMDMAITGGSEAAITEIGMAGFTNLTAMTEEQNPDRASIPFDKDRAGFVMGEGGGVLILERLDKALARGAKIYAEVVGYGTTSEAYHMTAPLPDGSGIADAMRLAIEEAGIDLKEIGYINAHGTGTPANDLPETLGVKAVFGDYAYKIPFTSSKSMTGHLLGAAGAVEAAVCALAMKHGFVPPTAGLEVPGEGCDLDYVPKVGREASIKYSLSNSLGFGGHCASVCLKSYK